MCPAVLLFCVSLHLRVHVAFPHPPYGIQFPKSRPDRHLLACPVRTPLLSTPSHLHRGGRGAVGMLGREGTALGRVLLEKKGRWPIGWHQWHGIHFGIVHRMHTEMYAPTLPPIPILRLVGPRVVGQLDPLPPLLLAPMCREEGFFSDRGEGHSPRPARG